MNCKNWQIGSEYDLLIKQINLSTTLHILQTQNNYEAHKTITRWRKQYRSYNYNENCY